MHIDDTTEGCGTALKALPNLYIHDCQELLLLTCLTAKMKASKGGNETSQPDIVSVTGWAGV